VKRRRVIFAPSARGDLLSIYHWISDQAGEDVGLRYVERIERYCAGFDIGAERGQRLGGAPHGLRFVGFRRSATIVFLVADDTVTIIGVYRAGLDWRSRLSGPPRTET